MKKVRISIALLLCACALSSCTSRAAKFSDANLESRIANLSLHIENALEKDPYYKRFANYEEAVTCISSYIEDGEGSYNDVSDAWIYISRLLDALDNEINWISDEYFRIYPD